ncbi:MAG: hypothetical protein A2X36_08665 [Elusimicrobia bacterium GWA2_69_24]|nr:MAG: hypothetical protein A2X36_08665 [Elusimicrobia bacterium GWA2_69_24]HBL17596.1 hypothetical protein [Elusimicrobiota bacterium]
MRSSNRILIPVLALALIAPFVQAEVLEDVVAKVNGTSLLLSEYRKNLRSVIENYQHSMPDLLRDEEAYKEIRKKVLDQMIDDELITQEAATLQVKVHDRELEKGVTEVSERSFRTDESGRTRSDAEVDKALRDELKKEGITWDTFRERIRRQLKIRKVVEVKVAALVKDVDEKAQRAAFDKLKFVVQGDTSVVKGMEPEEGQAYLAFGMRLKDNHSERVHVSHILAKAAAPTMVGKTQALEKAKALKKRLDGGADFYVLAQKDSDDLESAPRGGDLGWILRGWMPKAFEEAAFALPVGEVSVPVESDFGYHLIRAQEKKASESLIFEKVQAPVKEFISSIRYQKELLAYVKRLRDKATIELKLPAE